MNPILPPMMRFSNWADEVELEEAELNNSSSHQTAQTQQPVFTSNPVITTKPAASGKSLTTIGKKETQQTPPSHLVTPPRTIVSSLATVATTPNRTPPLALKTTTPTQSNNKPSGTNAWHRPPTAEKKVSDAGSHTPPSTQAAHRNTDVIQKKADVMTKSKATPITNNTASLAAPVSAQHVKNKNETIVPTKSDKELVDQLKRIVQCCVNGIQIRDLESRVDWAQHLDKNGSLQTFLTKNPSAVSLLTVDGSGVVRMKSVDLFASLMTMSLSK